MNTEHTAIDQAGSRQAIRQLRVQEEAAVVQALLQQAVPLQGAEADVQTISAELIHTLRRTQEPDLLSQFLTEYNLSSEEGMALMTLAEALLRVPDAQTQDLLIEDRVSDADWSAHLGKSESKLVNTATLGLSVSQKVLYPKTHEKWTSRIRNAIKLVSEPSLRITVRTLMQYMGKQFVLAESIEGAVVEARSQAKKGNQSHAGYSFDMLGEAACTAHDADKYFESYRNAIVAIAASSSSDTVEDNHGISIKLSALHPQYRFEKRQRVLDELVPLVQQLVDLAKDANLGLNIDAEEAERLDLSLDVIKAIIENPVNQNWKGLGVVVQAYQKRAPAVIDWLVEQAEKHSVRLMVRLVKGAYWDTEVKQAQVMGDVGYPVFTRKLHTDLSYWVCARKLLDNRHCLYPQFASHNVHTLVAVAEIAGEQTGYELQRLHGMGEAAHEVVCARYGLPSRIYAPVGAHQDLLAYLVRRLLENGANSSFVHHVFDDAKDPIELSPLLTQRVAKMAEEPAAIALPVDIYNKIRSGEKGLPRPNSQGLRLTEPEAVAEWQTALQPWRTHTWQASSLIASSCAQWLNGSVLHSTNPSQLDETVGEYAVLAPEAVPDIMAAAQQAQLTWAATPVEKRAKALDKSADLLHEHTPELIALLQREAGKTYDDCIAEIREAIDFLRFYSRLGEKAEMQKREALGVFICISPWNFPLAIFAGQIGAALIMGNSVVAKPAQQTPVIAYRAIQLMHEAGVPSDVLQLTLGGADVGAALTSSQGVSGVSFTGSTAVASIIRRSLTQAGNTHARLIAETGGINAMLVDSSALTEQVVRDIVTSAFRSAGQRCSALRLLVVQEDCLDRTMHMLKGALAELEMGNPEHLTTDCGPVIDEASRSKLSAQQAHLMQKAKSYTQLEVSGNTDGTFIVPSIALIASIDDLDQEFFGPLLHVVSYKAKDLSKTMHAINAKGFGLTLGVHSRIGAIVDQVTELAEVGNVYVNRNQVGAVVGVQPFGGEGLSGTGPKAGGYYTLHATSRRKGSDEYAATAVAEFVADAVKGKLPTFNTQGVMSVAEVATLQALFSDELDANWLAALQAGVGACSVPINLAGPTGEQNQLSFKARGLVYAFGPNQADALKQTLTALAFGNSVCTVLNAGAVAKLHKAGVPAARLLAKSQFSAAELSNPQLRVMCWADNAQALQSVFTQAGENANGLVQLNQDTQEHWQFFTEKVVSTDTTAAGGNASLLMEAD